MSSDNLKRVDLILYDSYIQTIKNSVGSNMFKNLFASIDGKPKIDVLDNGQLSCAYFTSIILHIFKLIPSIHATVDGTQNDLINNFWEEIDNPKEGSVLIWEAQNFEGEMHRHIGFYIGNGQAISNNTSQHVPAIHHWTFGEKDGQPVRKIEKIYWNNKLDN
jgi:hypothetical protein